MFFASWILARDSFSDAAPCPERLDLSSSTGLVAGLPPAICPRCLVFSVKCLVFTLAQPANRNHGQVEIRKKIIDIYFFLT